MCQNDTTARWILRSGLLSGPFPAWPVAPFLFKRIKALALAYGLVVQPTIRGDSRHHTPRLELA